MPTPQPRAGLAATLRKQGIVQVLRHRDFAFFTATQWVSLIGMWSQRIGLGWLTWELTHSGFWLGAVALASSLPSVVVTPLGGVLADRVPRLTLMRVSMMVSTAFSASLAALTLAGWIDERLLCALALATGCNQALATPARMTITPALVPRGDLSAAIALNAFTFQSSTFVGPALAGVVISGAGVGWAFAVNAVSYLPQLAVLFRIRLTSAEETAGRRGVLSDLAAGVSYAVSHRGIGPVLLLAIVCSFLARYLPDLMPGFVGAVFHRGPQALALLMSGMGVGGMTGALWLANRNRVEGTTAVFFTALAVMGALTFAFALNDHYALAVAAAAALGFATATMGSSAQILIQNAVTGAMRARVLSLYSISFRGAPALGAMTIGALSERFGLQAPVAAGAALSLLAVAILYARRRAIATASEAAADTREAAGEAPPSPRSVPSGLG